MSHTSHSTTKTLTISIILGIFIIALEIFGSIKSGSLALLSDASHAFSDLLALTITLFALRIANLPSTHKHTFGYHRAEVLGALINGLMLLGMAVFIGREAWIRLYTPREIDGIFVSIIGFVSIFPSLFAVIRLRKSKNLNIKSAFLHALGDTLSSVIVIISGVVILITGFTKFDSIASFAVVALLIIGAVRLLKQVVIILLEGTPPGIDREKISKIICNVPGVHSTHDVHLWTLCSDVIYLTGHLVVDNCQDMKKAQHISARATKTLNYYGIHHATFQIETPDHSCVKEESCEIIH